MFRSKTFNNYIQQSFFIISMYFQSLFDLSRCFWPLHHAKAVISNLNNKLQENTCLGFFCFFFFNVVLNLITLCVTECVLDLGLGKIGKDSPSQALSFAQ